MFLRPFSLKNLILVGDPEFRCLTVKILEIILGRRWCGVQIKFPLYYILYSILRRSKRLGYCIYDQPAVADLFSTADDDLFHRIKSNSNHVLHPYLPSNTGIPYKLRTRFHRMTLINKTKHLNEADFIIRLLYKHSY